MSPKKNKTYYPSTHSIDDFQQSEARFKVMFDTAAVGIGIMGLDRKLIDANPALCRLYGRSKEELVGQIPALVTYPEDYPESTREFENLVTGKKDHYWLERRYIRKNGDVFWAHVTMSIVRATDGKPLYLIGMIVDINEQKRLLADLKESESRFRAVYENSAIGISLIGLDRRPFDINPAISRLSGFTKEEFLSKSVGEIAHPDDIHIGDQEFQDLIDGKHNSYQIEKRFLHKGGGYYCARLTISGVRGPDGNLEYIVSMTEDITEQKLAAQKLLIQEVENLRLLEQRVTERTSELAEANQRLLEEIEQRKRVEQALAAKAAEEAVSAERTRLARDLHDAVTQTLFSASLIAEVLPELWQIDAVEAKKSAEELKQLTRGALAEMRTLLLELRPAALLQSRFEDLLKQLTEAVIGRARLPVNLRVDGERTLPPEVQVALYRISQESLNNIVKYARAEQVDIHLSFSATGAYLEIADNGVGFDHKKVKPTSLGMRIMRERAEAIGAEFSVTSNPGKGTIISVTWNSTDESPSRKLR